ncbi:MAG: class I tRNA ligase family protein [Patescibacteria group bacterium]
MKEDSKKVENVKSEIALREEATLAFWEKERIFEQSLEATKNGKEFVFYDGPPFGTGLPHYGHILTSVLKDAIPRYQTMRGRHVRRVWGWDCHGLPIENLIEGELGLKNRNDIEVYGIEKFNEAARASVLRYDTEWQKMIPRIGRWVDMEHSYKTLDAKYTESIWWAFKTLYDKKLVYQGFKAMHVCPRCETTLSNNEVADGYKNVSDLSVTAKFELLDEPGTFVLAWTTTPWTLPGNVALAVGRGVGYAKWKNGEEFFILAEDLAPKYFPDFDSTDFSRYETFPVDFLIGKAYKPIFNYYAQDEKLENHKNGWKIYEADFVTADSGTGVVHIAPAFGEDDMALGKKENLPFIQHVGMDGIMKPEVKDFAGMQVKPKSDDEKTRLSTDIAVLKYLQDKKLFFSKEKINHSYPHCWRCDTPLLNYAAGSWFVKAPELKDKMLSENAGTTWVPAHMRDGRFGNWIANARDWAISRSRYWGAPLPVWECAVCNKHEVFGSCAELAAHTKKSGNTYLIMRHGQAESNVRNIVSSKVGSVHDLGLTSDGRISVFEATKDLKEMQVDMIVASPFARTRETAETVAQEVGMDPKKIVFDTRLQEINTGVFDGRPIEEYRTYFASMLEKFTKATPEEENLLEVKRRVMAVLEELEAKEQGKTILIVTHEYPVWMLSAGAQGMTVDEALAIKEGKDDFLSTGDFVELSFTPFPHNADFEFDLHRPYIDQIHVDCSCGGTMVRVPYVFDCWFESGSMPYAQFHYPFENKELFEKNFPADFIAEGVDQTRGWFYNMLVLSTGLFGKAPFNNVIVNGMVLAEDGQKMSKKLKNYPDPRAVIDRYGADAVRYYMLSSPITRGEDLSFSERGVDEVVKKLTMRLLNVVSFYELHGSTEVTAIEKSTHPLDRFIFARMATLTKEMTTAFDAYELDRVTKPLMLFVDDLSTWYLRRSRDRFKSDDVLDRTHAILTTRTVLLEFSKLLAPIMPFLAEEVYRRLGGTAKSVHLESWPLVGAVDEVILVDMTEVRRVVSVALEARAKAGIKVRQPLGKLTIKEEALSNKTELLSLIADEVNVKRVVFDKTITQEVLLDTEITLELKSEGRFRDFVRSVQDLRKKEELKPSDMVLLTIATNEDGDVLIRAFEDELKKTAILREVVLVPLQEVSKEAIIIDEIPFLISIQR